MYLPATRRRRAAVALESAYAHLAFLTLMMLLVVGGYATLRYQTVSWMACETARYASVHGACYAQDTGNASPTAAQIYSQVVLPLAVNMDASNLSALIQVVDMTTGQVTSWDSSNLWPTSQATNTSQPAPVTNHVRVTISYQWFPEMFLAGPITLTSVSEIPMTY